jgi:hypothetical protein
MTLKAKTAYTTSKSDCFDFDFIFMRYQPNSIVDIMEVIIIEDRSNGPNAWKPFEWVTLSDYYSEISTPIHVDNELIQMQSNLYKLANY